MRFYLNMKVILEILKELGYSKDVEQFDNHVLGSVSDLLILKMYCQTVVKSKNKFWFYIGALQS